MSVERTSDGVTDRLEMSGRVDRYACWPTINRQDVGHHCWQIYMIHRRVFGLPEAIVAEYIMLHDSEELIVGDPPFPTKRDNPDFKAASEVVEARARARMGYDLPMVSAADRVRVKICDLLEMMTFGMHEREMGNLHAVPIVTRTRQAVEEMSRDSLLPDEQRAVELFVREEWRRHTQVLRRGDPTICYTQDTRGVST